MKPSQVDSVIYLKEHKVKCSVKGCRRKASMIIYSKEYKGNFTQDRWPVCTNDGAQIMAKVIGFYKYKQEDEL